tara:strand:- start:719 stop:1027 length:309 start_codon:yes stop_codon:yes gene_type:complete
MSGTEPHSGLKITAHAHANPIKTAASRDFSKQAEVQTGFLIGRRNAHKANNWQIHRVTAFRYKTIRLAGPYARFLRLFADVNLNEALHLAALGVKLTSQGPS